MNTKIERKSNIPTGVQINKISHSIFIIDDKQKKFPLQDVLQNKLKRIGKN